MALLFTKICLDKSSSFIEMTLKGEISAKEMTEVYQKANAHAQIFNVSKLLINVADLQHDFDAIDIVIQMPKIADSLNDIQLARVVGYRGFMHDLFLQKAQRFGIFVENFDSYESAKDWLSKHH